MKVAHLVIGGEVGGGQLVALRLARAARARGDEAVVVSPSPGRFLGLAKREGLPVRVLPLGRSFDLRAVRRLKRLLERERADLLHTHVMLPGNVIARLAGRAAKIPVVSHMHNDNTFRDNRAVRAAQRLLDNATARLCARIVAVSDDTRRSLERQGYPPGSIVVVRNGVEPPGPRSGRLRAELGLPAEVPVIGTVGRLSAAKGHEDLLAALASLSHSDAVAVLVGTDHEHGGAFRRHLEELAASLGVRDRVVFAGYRPDAAELIGDLDVFVLPSWIEGLPLTVLEAMAHGVPVVATRVGGVPEIVADGETGLLVPSRDVQALAGALGALLDDPGRARRLGEAGRERALRELSAEAMAAKVLALYDEIAFERAA